METSLHLSLHAATILGLNEAETMALRHLLVWLEEVMTEGREITPEEMSEEFTAAEMDALAGIRKAFARHESIAAGLPVE